MVRLTTPYPLTRLAEAWTWHSKSKALSARFGREGWLQEFTRLISEGWSWGLEVDGVLSGIVLLEPTLLAGDSSPRDAHVHIALARSAWGREVIQTAAQQIIPSAFAACPSLNRLTAWTAASNHPARAVAEAIGFSLEGELRAALGSESLLLYGLTRQEVTNGQWT